MKKKRNKNSFTGGSDVGYCNPPKHSQFQKGQSGNPNGRPKKLMGLNELLDEAFLQKMQVNGKSVQLQDMLVRSLIRHALQGKQGAMNIVFTRLARHDAKNGTEEFDPEIDDKIALNQWLCRLGEASSDTSTGSDDD